MNKRWASGFTIVELIIVILVLAILATIAILSYNGVRESAMNKVAQSDLQHVATEMERTYQKTNSYPTAIPDDIKSSSDVTLTLVESGKSPFYSNISPVQMGTLFANICQALVNEGYGQGQNQGGQTQNYITGCGNWNHNNMQFTGWTTKQWPTPVTSAQLLDYANSYTTSDTWNKSQEPVTKNFYTELVKRYTKQGGTFPITTFWDYWATPQNGGVMPEALPTNFVATPYYCVEAAADNYDDIIWHITQSGKLIAGKC